MSIIYFFLWLGVIYFFICIFIDKISNIFMMCFMRFTHYSPCNFSLMDTTIFFPAVSLFYLTKPFNHLVLPVCS